MADGGGARACKRLEGCRGALRARCGCGREAAIDPGPWLAQGLGALPLQCLEARLRCACGAREVGLSEDVAPTAAPRPGGPIWMFR